MHDAQAAGWPVVWSGGMGGVRFAYVEPRAEQARVFEISELTDGVSAVNKLIHDAARAWNGNDPIRVLG